MRYEFKLPDLAEGMVEGEVVSWLVAAGDEVGAEQPVVEVMTDKATVVISSPHAGKVLEICHEDGAIVPVGEVLFVLDAEGLSEEEAPEPATPGKRNTAPEPRAHNETPVVPPMQRPAAVPRGAGKVRATPATRRLAREQGVDIQGIEGTGKGGRVTAEDVRAAARGKSGGRSRLAASMSATVPVRTLADVGASGRRGTSPEVRDLLEARAAAPGDAAEPEERDERIRVRGLRRAIYETMARSKSTAAHFTYVEEVDCTGLVRARERLQEAVERGVGVRLSYLPLIAKAALLALRRHPKMNATMDDAAGEIVLHRYLHLGIATATEAGLAVPVLRHADRLTLFELAARVAELADKAREGALTPEEARGSTFTITSLGKLGGLLATPIINHPEVAILGVHLMRDRAVVRGGAVVVRPMMNISLSFDHRVIDGHEGAAFAQTVRAYLEDPELMMLEMA